VPEKISPALPLSLMSIECREAGADLPMYRRRAQSWPRRQFKNIFPRGDEASRALGSLEHPDRRE
jgi:hypothetical protein